MALLTLSSIFLFRVRFKKSPYFGEVVWIILTADISDRLVMVDDRTGRSVYDITPTDPDKLVRKRAEQPTRPDDSEPVGVTTRVREMIIVEEVDNFGSLRP